MNACLFSFLLLGLLGCTPESSDKAPSSGADTGAPDDSAGGDSAAGTDSGGEDSGKLPPLPMPWDAEGFWTNPGPLEHVLNPDPDGDQSWILRVATSEDGETWESTDLTPAKNFSSIDLFIIPNQGVIILGMVYDPDTYMDKDHLYALVSSDLVTWGSHDFEIIGAKYGNLVDPALYWTSWGMPAITYYATDVFDVDPVLIGGDHEVRQAIWDGVQFVEQDLALFQDRGLVDPMICTLGGERTLFVTQSSERVLMARENADGTYTEDESLRWEGQTVPFCRADEAKGQVQVLSQGDGEYTIPRKGHLDDDGFTDDGELFEAFPWEENNGSAFAVGQFGATWYLFSAVNANLPDTSAGKP